MGMTLPLDYILSGNTLAITYEGDTWTFTKATTQQADGGKTTSDNKTTSGKIYTLGEEGPAGGIVFYDKGKYTNGQRYLEAAPEKMEFTAAWGSYTDVNGTDWTVGTGKRNTKLIVAALGKDGQAAAQRCANMNVSDYKDWFLPSREEMDLMYKNLKQKGLGSFKDDYYWTSTQLDYDYSLAWTQHFSNGNQTFNDFKVSEHYVRAIRDF